MFRQKDPKPFAPGRGPHRVPLPQSRLPGLRNSLRSDSPRPQNRGFGPGAQPRPQAPGCSAASFDSPISPIVTGPPPPKPAVSAATRNPINLTEQSKITIHTLYLTVYSIIAVPQNRYQTPRHGSLRRAPVLLVVVVCLIPWGAARAQMLPTLSIDSPPPVTEPEHATGDRDADVHGEPERGERGDGDGGL